MAKYVNKSKNIQLLDKFNTTLIEFSNSYYRDSNNFSNRNRNNVYHQ